jgi:hypothetical protein
MAALVDAPLENQAVGPAEVHVFKNAMCSPLRRAQSQGAKPVIPNTENFTWFYVPNVLGTDKIEGAGFRSHNVPAIHLTKTEWPDAIWIPNRVKSSRGQQEQRKGSADKPQNIQESGVEILFGRTCQQVEDHFCIGRRLKNCAFSFELMPKLSGINEVSVVGNGNGPTPRFDEDGLCVRTGALSVG